VHTARKGEGMSDKRALLNKLDDGYTAFRNRLEGISEEETSKPVLDNWTLQELLGHVAGWHREMSGALERMGRGERPVPEGVDYSDADTWNAKFSAGKKGSPLRDTLRDLDDSFLAFRSAAAALPEDRFEPGRTVDRMVHATGINHYIEHGEHIQTGRKGA
jgi:hypothetical protein